MMRHHRWPGSTEEPGGFTPRLWTSTRAGPMAPTMAAPHQQNGHQGTAADRSPDRPDLAAALALPRTRPEKQEQAGDVARTSRRPPDQRVRTRRHIHPAQQCLGLGVRRGAAASHQRRRVNGQHTCRWPRPFTRHVPDLWHRSPDPRPAGPVLEHPARRDRPCCRKAAGRRQPWPLARRARSTLQKV